MDQSLLQGIILAAGKSSRFKGQITKVLTPVCGKEMIRYSIELLHRLDIPTTIVVGYQKELLQERLQALYSHLCFKEQCEQKGTGDALYVTYPVWHAENILVINGDMPLITDDLVKRLIEKHSNSYAAITFAVAHQTDDWSGGYGRVIINENKKLSIVEADSFKGKIDEHPFVNAGIYIFSRSFLEKAFLVPDKWHNGLNKNNEMYLTDLIGYAHKNAEVITTVVVPFDSIRGVNTLRQLCTVEDMKMSQLLDYHMDKGVRFFAPHMVFIDDNVVIGEGTNIGAGVRLTKGTVIGSHCSIGAFSHIENSQLGDNVTVKEHTIVSNGVIASFSSVGPFAHVRGETTIGQHCTIGNFVEVTKSCIQDRSKIKHHAYIGNALVENDVNIGAGTIICNFNGKEKNNTIIREHAFIGSNNCLIAPLTIGKGAVTAAGSTITETVPDESLAIARSRQIIKLERAKDYKKNITPASLIENNDNIYQQD